MIKIIYNMTKRLSNQNIWTRLKNIIRMIYNMTRWLSNWNIWTQLKNVIRMIPLLARVLCPHIAPSFMVPELVTWDSPRHYILRSGNPIKTGDQIPNLYIDIHIWHETYPSPPKKKPIHQRLCMVLSPIFDGERWQPICHWLISPG